MSSKSLYFLAWRTLPFIPASVINLLKKIVVRYIFKKDSKAVKRMRSNYQIFHPDIDHSKLNEMVKKGIDSYLRYWIETFTLNSWSKEKILNSVTPINEEILNQALAKDKGVVVAITHSANWDLAGAYYTLKRSPIKTVAEVLEPRELFEKFVAYRESLGMEIFPLEPKTLVKLMNRAREKHIIALLADRDLTINGVKVFLAGMETSMPSGPALIAIETGAPLLTANIYYLEQGIAVDFSPEIEIPSEGTREEKVQIVTQKIADRFTKNIGSHTHDWHMMQKVWLEK